MNIHIPVATDSFICLKGSFCGVTYYMTSMDIHTLADSLHFEKDLNSTQRTFAERVQRNLDEMRAEKEIYKNYLKNEGTRFFNSLVVSIIPEKDDCGFYDLEEHGEQVVTLKLKKNVKKVVVDGQHRLYAMRKLRDDNIKGLNDNREDLKTLQVPVIFVIFDRINCHMKYTEPVKDSIIKETRRVFTALNKTAKKIDKYTTLIVDDSDFSAIVARSMLEQDLLDEDYVKWAISGTQLTGTDVYYTSLHVINEMIEDAYSSFFDINLDDSDLSTEENTSKLISEYFDDVRTELGVSLRELIQAYFNLDVFKLWKKHLNEHHVKISRQPEKTELNAENKKTVRTYRDTSIMYQVAGQKAVFKAVLNCLQDFGDKPSEILSEMTKRVNLITQLGFLKKTDDLWSEILVNKKDAMIAKERNIDIASQIIETIITSDKHDERTLNEKIDKLRTTIVDELAVVGKEQKIKNKINDYKAALQVI